MANPRDLTKNQKETLKKLLLKQKQWEKEKSQLKRAKAKPKSKDTKVADASNNIRPIQTVPSIPKHVYNLDPKRYEEQYKKRKIKRKKA